MWDLIDRLARGSLWLLLAVSLPIASLARAQDVAGAGTEAARAALRGSSLPRDAGELGRIGFFVSPDGDDRGEGTFERPFATVARGRDAVRASGARGVEPVTVHLRGGTYYLAETLVLGPEDSGDLEAPVVYAAWRGEEPVISGGMRLELSWRGFRDGIWKARVPPGTRTDQLFVNGVRRRMARYPDFDPDARILGGTAADAFGPERAARWEDPAGGFIHAMHRHMWGDFHYRITGEDSDGGVVFEGGWQNNRRLGMHAELRMVENVFEELDAPDEWFLDEASDELYFFPPAGLDLGAAVVEGVRLRHLVELRGSQQAPVHHVRFRGVAFRHAARTFMDNREPLLRSDWTTYRGGAVLFWGAEDCGLEDCDLVGLGGNAVFVDGYNRRVALTGCRIADVGANGIAFVGRPEAVRSPLFEYGERQRLEDLDLDPGPRSGDYPADCLVEDCLLTRNGRVEKQTAGVQIAMARRITVRHCSIYDTPRAGINIGDGCWGGHLIEFCDVFDTVKETGDHGSFNSWGRDRYWGLKDFDLNVVTLGEHRALPLLDVVDPIVLRNNRWRCDHGWDIDLDDGSSNYRIYDNLCLNGGIKLREGFYRVCENNVVVGNSFHPHVWYRNSRDVFRNNIVFGEYRPIRVPQPWGEVCDRNLLHAPGQVEPVAAEVLSRQSGLDRGSVIADARFVDPASGDYRVRPGSPALDLGFRNFPMDRFGVRTPRLRAIARTPVLPGSTGERGDEAGPAPVEREWLGATIVRLSGRARMSAVGLGQERGVLVLTLPEESDAARLRLREADVILAVGSREVITVEEMLRAYGERGAGERVALVVWRDQDRVVLRVRKL